VCGSQINQKKSTLLSAVTTNAESDQTQQDDAGTHRNHGDNAHVDLYGGRFDTLELIVHHLLASTLVVATGCATIFAFHAGTNFLVWVGDDALFHPAVAYDLAGALFIISID